MIVTLFNNAITEIIHWTLHAPNWQLSVAVGLSINALTSLIRSLKPRSVTFKYRKEDESWVVKPTNIRWSLTPREN